MKQIKLTISFSKIKECIFSTSVKLQFDTLVGFDEYLGVFFLFF